MAPSRRPERGSGGRGGPGGSGRGARDRGAPKRSSERDPADGKDGWVKGGKRAGSPADERGRQRAERRDFASDAKPERGDQRRREERNTGLAGRDPFIGVLTKRGKQLMAEPFFDRGRRLSVEKHARARAGDLVLIEPSAPRSNHGRILRVLGKTDNASNVIESFMLNRGLRRRFDPLVNKRANEAAERPHDSDGVRLDLRDLVTFTIDPPSARDFDDAVSAQRIDADTIRVWVHIADVSAHVPPGSPIDREAQRRATSVYVPGKVEPMLPEALSNGACSLVPGADRLAVTAILDFVGATRVRSEFKRSLIRSDVRLDYPQVDRIFAGTDSALAPWDEPLALARSVSAALDERRQERGALVIASAEPDFAFDPRGHITGQTAEEQTESHTLIEHLMIAANEAVAELFASQKRPALYRVHEQPDPARVQRLVDQLAALDVPTPPLPERMNKEEAAAAVAEISFVVDQYARKAGRGRQAFGSLVLRSLKRAYYTPRNHGHAGLGSQAYCHFTSPIRRYPDLVCHRALLAAIGGGEEQPAGGELERMGEWCSDRERDAMSIERDADAIARAFVLEKTMMDAGHDVEFEGEVTGVIGAGAFVRFGEGFEGMLPVRRMAGDWWEVDALEVMLVGTDSGRALRVGDPVRVQVERIDTARGRVDLRPVELQTHEVSS